MGIQDLYVCNIHLLPHQTFNDLKKCCIMHVKNIFKKVLGLYACVVGARQKRLLKSERAF
jgi:hypothetical protein